MSLAEVKKASYEPVDFTELKPKITVIGIGGAGGNAVNNMIRANLQGVYFVAVNTDAQALGQSLSACRLQLGAKITQGLGAGSRPEVGRAAAEESLEQIIEQVSKSNMVFITAGMGGGTGTGAAPVIAQACREQGILTVGVVTKPFHFEGAHRMRSAERGIEELSKNVDTLIIIPNQNLFGVATNKTTFAEAFKIADDVLHAGVRGVTDLMLMPGLINLDFADIRAVMSEMGKAMMGTGEAKGEGRALAAANAAILNPLLDDVSMQGARGVLINITGSLDMTLFEVDEAANRIREEVDPEANIIFGSTFDESLEGVIRVSVVATGIDGRGKHFNFSESSPVSGSGSEGKSFSDSAADSSSKEMWVSTESSGRFSPLSFSGRSEEGENRDLEEMLEMYPSERHESPLSFGERGREREPILGEQFGPGKGRLQDRLEDSKKKGFFRRVAETLRGVSSEENEEEAREVRLLSLESDRFLDPAEIESQRVEGQRTEVHRPPVEPSKAFDSLPSDIPAYLRRKKR